MGKYAIDKDMLSKMRIVPCPPDGGPPWILMTLMTCGGGPVNCNEKKKILLFDSWDFQINIFQMTEHIYLRRMTQIEYAEFPFDLIFKSRL